jgi:glycerol-3-phosphate dehydrogenase
MTNAPLSREDSLAKLRDTHLWDVLIIGGGASGLGTAVDAAARGYRTLLVEARDFASGTSSRSSKMFHGGLRYLEQLEFGLVREALHERELSLTTLAPHLVKPLPAGYPLPTDGLQPPDRARLELQGKLEAAPTPAPALVPVVPPR